MQFALYKQRPLKFECILLTLLVSFLILSCKKDAENKEDVIVPKTKTEMLTSVSWRYEEYFINFNESNTMVAYKKGKANNLHNLDHSILNYYINGTYEETLDSGMKVAGTWKFIENETQIELRINQQVITINVYYLDAETFVWANRGGDLVGKMVKK